MTAEEYARAVGHSDLSTTKRYDKRGEDAKKKAAGRIRVPYVEPSVD